MMGRTISIVTIVCLAVSPCGRAGNEPQDDSLRIYLPREIAVDSNVPSLGQIGIIHGEASLAVRAGEIAMGRIAAPGQQVTIDRLTVLSRLASNGIPASKVKLTGAEEIKVRQQGQTISAGEFVGLARLFLERNPPARSICESELMRGPVDLILEGSRQDVKLSPRLLPSSTPNQVRIQVAVVSGGKEIGSREVGFRLKFNSHKVVTLVEVPAGAVISPENVKVEKTVSSYPEPAHWSTPYGLVARRRLPANTVLSSNMIGPVEPAIVVKRNQNVIIRIAAGGLVVTAMGQTVEEGSAGEYVRVRNVDSQRIILARVNEDGTVEPVL
jgi:flagella basal body P-ring formation protein FlgA